MLNLQEAIEFTDTDQEYLDSVPKVKDSWDITITSMKQVKRHMKEELWRIQDGKCAYCMSTLNPLVNNEGDLPLDGDREHIVPKSIHPIFIFEPLNFVLACITCNRTLKRNIDTIRTLNVTYADCDFYIIHPILDNVEEHIGFQKGTIIYLSLDKGRWTEELFQLSSEHYTRQRAESYLVSRMQTQVDDILNNPFGINNI